MPQDFSHPSTPRIAGLVPRAIASLHRDDGAAAAVSFVIAFPIFLTIVGVLVQISLMVNAKIMVTAAADAAARAAVTSLPDEKPENIGRAAWIALAPLSPEAASTTASEASADYDALKTAGVDVPETFPARYTYAKEAAAVSWSPEAPAADFVHEVGREVEVTVTYKFLLTVPGAKTFASATDGTVAGVEGRFWEVTGKAKAMTSHGRKVRSLGNGWPE